MPFVSFAQNHEDVVLFRALREVDRGFYIDIGAQDPETDSVTKAFYDRGWRGINVEPCIDWHMRLVRERPRDVNLNLAASNVTGEFPLYEVLGTGLSTLDMGIAHGHRSRNLYPVRESRTATTTLRDICESSSVSEVHFLKIDVEGAEAQVLDGADFDRFRPWIILVEAIDPVTLEQTHGRWEHLLFQNGYEFALFDGLNRFYCDGSRPQLMARLSAPANVLDNFISVPRQQRSHAFPAGFGINFFGQFTSSTGLGVTARQSARAIARAGIPLACFDVQSYYPTPDISEELEEIKDCLAGDPAATALPINLYCLPVIEFPRLAQSIPAAFSAGRFHAGVVWWETTQLNPEWAGAMARLDALVAHSEFLTDVLRNQLPLTPVLTGKQPLFLESGIAANRDAFGLPHDATVFVSSFDPSSDPARKNPAATIAAFRHAFSAGEADVRLVLRLNNAAATQMAIETRRLLMDAAGGDGRIGFALEPMSYRQVLSLYASADAYVSLHRAEGLGLGMLESMRLGVPVIATGWSGNMTFMDHRSACLVRHRLAPVSGNHPFYRPEVLGPNAIWAEPVIEDAIAWMRLLHREPDERRRLGQAARSRSERYQEDALYLDWLVELSRIWQCASLLPKVEEKFSAMKARP